MVITHSAIHSTSVYDWAHEALASLSSAQD